MKRLFVFVLLLLAPRLRAQLITQQPQPQTVSVGQTAQFTITLAVSESCTVMWQKNGVNIKGGLNLLSYMTPAVLITDNGARYGAVVYNCTPAQPSAHSTTALLTVASTPPPPPLPTLIVKLAFVTYDDNTIPPVRLIINQIIPQPNGTSSKIPALTIALDGSGNAVGAFALDPALLYETDLEWNGIAMPFNFIDWPFVTIWAPSISEITFSATFFKATSTPTQPKVKAASSSFQ
jgi:hypothetical protein